MRGKLVDRMRDVALLMYARATARGRDTGDVPGWVLVTIMTAGLVTALWIVADDRLKEIFGNALDSVAGGPG